MPRILCDMHHEALFYSLQLLFEKRLGWELYRQIGMDWYEQGFWNVFPHPGTAGQYLSLNQAVDIPKGMEGLPFPDHCLLNKTYKKQEDGVYYVSSNTTGKIQKAITLEKFKNMEFDVLLSSIPQHIGPFNRLIREYQPKAKHIFQVGNAWGQLPGIKNILASTAPFYVSPGINVVFYHQEFDLDVFKYQQPVNHNIVNSYIHYMQRLDIRNQYASLLPGYTFKSYGAGMDNCLNKYTDIANEYINSGWTWHFKPEGDGYGYGPHCSFACGRPLIVWAPFYNGKLAGQLFEDGTTCIDISKRNPQENARLILLNSRPENHIRMCENVYKKFNQVVSFDRDEENIRKFIDRLI